MTESKKQIEDTLGLSQSCKTFPRWLALVVALGITGVAAGWWLSAVEVRKGYESSPKL